jgi:hypothetical protein
MQDGMPLRLLERAWDPDGAANADWFWVDEHTALLLDGATPRDNQRVSAAVNDTVWLVRRFVEEFVRAGPGGVRERVERARAALKREYDGLCAAAGLTPDDTPFACLTIVQQTEAQLELFNMGDLTTLVRFRDGSVQRFGESAVRELDRRALAEMRRHQQAGVAPHAERYRRAWSLIAAHREQRNRLAGYDVLDLDAGGADRFEHHRFDAGGVRDVLMLSDGFYRLVDTFERYTDSTLLQALERRGLAALLGELRELERGDLECIEHLRFKTHDDATALWLALD